MTQQQLVALVPWTVQEPPFDARVGALVRGALSLVSTVVTFGTSTGAPLSPTWDLPADPDDDVGLGLVRLRGDAPWLPGAAGARHRVRATQRQALVEDAAGRRPPVRSRSRSCGSSEPVPTESADGTAERTPGGR